VSVAGPNLNYDRNCLLTLKVIDVGELAVARLRRRLKAGPDDAFSATSLGRRDYQLGFSNFLQLRMSIANS